MSGRGAGLVLALAVSALSACATAPSIDGTYCMPGQDKTQRKCRYVVETDNGVWVASTESVRLAPRASLALQPPATKGGPFQLVDGQQSYTQVVDPVLARVVGTLKKGRHLLPDVEHASQASPTKKLIIEDGILVRLFDTTVGGVPDVLHLPCLAGILYRDPTASEPGGHGDRARAFYFRELDRSIEACPNVLAPDRPNKLNTQEDVFLVSLKPTKPGEADGEDEIEVVLTGSLGMFVPEGAPPALVQKVRRDFGPAAKE